MSKHEMKRAQELKSDEVRLFAVARELSERVARRKKK